MRVVYHRAALAELEAFAEQYFGYSPGTGERFLAEVTSSLMRCASHPESSPVFYRKLRKVSLTHFSLLLLYQFAGDVLTVAAIVDARRDPDAIRGVLDARLEHE